jgi:TolB-like protein/DNA-binding winged helix-turn-helix (wHTH) protein/Tfp pilus assembly protein PilF
MTAYCAAVPALWPGIHRYAPQARPGEFRRNIRALPRIERPPGKIAPGMHNDTAAAAGSESAGFEVDDLIVDRGQRRITRAGNEIPLSHLSFELLVTLARAAPDVVTFDQLTARVWPGLVITPETISQRVKLVRDALGDDPHAPRYIAGVRGVGYRMVAAVRPLRDRRRAELQAVPPPRPSPIELYGTSGPQPLPEPSDAQPAPPPSAEASDERRSGERRAAPAMPRTGAWLGALLVLGVLLAVPYAVTHFLRAPNAASAAAGIGPALAQPPRSIAVLPLVDMSPAGGNAYLGDGLAQELSARLARVRGLRVAARTSAFAFKDRQADVHVIARTLGVRHVLEGSVRREGDHLRVTAQLIDSSSGYDVWSQTYDRTWQDLLVIEDDLARSITSALQVVLSRDLAQQLTQSPTTQLAAYDLYLAGLAKLHGPESASHLEEAEQSFRQALSKDPMFALAYAGLCQRFGLGYEQTRDAALVPQAEAACGEALRLDGSLREVSAALAHLYVVSGRNAQAEALFRSALLDDPNDSDAYVGLGEALDGEHRTAEAERAFRQAVELDSTYWGAQTALGNFLFRHGRSAAAAAVYQHVTELIPASPLAFNNLGAALEMTGNFEGAAQAFERSLALEPTRSAYSNSGTVYYFLGRYADAARMFSRAAELAAEDHRVWGNLADALWQIDSRRDEARADYRRATELARRSLEVNPQDAVSWMQLAYYVARDGDSGRAQRYARRALAIGPGDLFVHYYGALIALERGDASAALASLDRAVRLGYPAQLVRAAPDFMSLRSDARFRQLLAAADKAPAG